MSDPLYSSLLSLLPNEYVNGNSSVCDHIEVATNYIKALEKNVKELQEKRDKLQEGPGSSSSSSLSLSSLNRDDTNNNNPRDDNSNNHVEIKAMSDFLVVEISVMVKEEKVVFPLSKVLNVLQEEGLNVVNCEYTKHDQTLTHIIHSQVDHGKMVDSSRLQNRLTTEIAAYAS